MFPINSKWISILLQSGRSAYFRDHSCFSVVNLRILRAFRSDTLKLLIRASHIPFAFDLCVSTSRWTFRTVLRVIQRRNKHIRRREYPQDNTCSNLPIYLCLTGSATSYYPSLKQLAIVRFKSELFNRAISTSCAYHFMDTAQLHPGIIYILPYMRGKWAY